MSQVELRGITKRFGPVTALNQVDFTLNDGEIHALLGENGAGKTTLMKVLYGMHQPDEGEIRIGGQAKTFKNSTDAIAQGIGMVHQHFMLVPVLTVAENIVAGKEPRRGIRFDMERAVREVQALSEQYGFSVDPRAKVEQLSVGERQRVEILKILYKGANTLIFDEPTAVLTPIEVKELFAAMRQLKAGGKSIIIITHKLYEVMEIADRITVLRDGRLIGSVDRGEVTMDKLAYMMVGRQVALNERRPAKKIGAPLCEVRGLSYRKDGADVLKNISLTVHEGEILGIAGIEGNGQTELLEALTGILQPDSMEMTVAGKKLSGGARAFLDAGVGHVPEDRMTRGLVLPLSISENAVLGYEKQEPFMKHGVFRWKQVRAFADRLIEEYQIKAPGSGAAVGSLSGGNQQKVVIARVFSQTPDFVVCAQPTRGVDIAASEYIHNVMLDYRDKGKAVLLVSADLDEIKALSDNIAVLYKGEIVAQDAAENFDDTRLGLLMTGAAREREVAQ